MLTLNLDISSEELQSNLKSTINLLFKYAAEHTDVIPETTTLRDIILTINK